jgi:hypothetical protein
MEGIEPPPTIAHDGHIPSAHVGRIDDEPGAGVRKVVKGLPEAGLIRHMLDDIECQDHIEFSRVSIAEFFQGSTKDLESELLPAVRRSGLSELYPGHIPA